MPYNPGVQYRGDVYRSRATEALFSALSNVLTGMRERGQRKDELTATLASLQGYGDQGDGGDEGDQAGATAGGGVGGGYNPTTGGNVGSEEDAADAEAMSGKKADSIRGLLGTYMPESKDGLKAKSLGELEGMLKGYTIKATMAEQQAKMQEMQALAALRRQKVADDLSEGAVYKRFSSTPAVPLNYGNDEATAEQGTDGTEAVATREPSFAERLMYSMSGTGSMAGKSTAFKNLIQYGRNQEGGETLTPSYTEDPVTGARTMTYGKQALPTGYNPAKAQPAIVMQHDEEGNVVGISQTDPRGHSTFHKVAGTGLKQARDENGNALSGYYVDAKGGLHDTRSAMEKVIGKKVEESATAPIVPNVPTNAKASDLVKGKQYMTSKGVATWDGKQFVK